MAQAQAHEHEIADSPLTGLFPPLPSLADRLPPVDSHQATSRPVSRSPSSHRKTPPPFDEKTVSHSAPCNTVGTSGQPEVPAPATALPSPVVVQPQPQLQPQPQFVSVAPPPAFFASRSSQGGITLTYPVVDASMLGGCSEVCRCSVCGFIGFTQLRLVPTVKTQLSLFSRAPAIPDDYVARGTNIADEFVIAIMRLS